MGPVQREQARGRGALRDPAPRARDGGRPRARLGAVPGLGQHPHRREWPEPARDRADGEGRPRAPGSSLLQDVLARGMAPEAVADQVLAAIRAERFWILTHDDEADDLGGRGEPPGPVAHRPDRSRRSASRCERRADADPIPRTISWRSGAGAHARPARAPGARSLSRLRDRRTSCATRSHRSRYAARPRSARPARTASRSRRTPRARAAGARGARNASRRHGRPQ